jgi:hypothetical protein
VFIIMGTYSMTTVVGLTFPLSYLCNLTKCFEGDLIHVIRFLYFGRLILIDV